MTAAQIARLGERFYRVVGNEAEGSGLAGRSSGESPRQPARRRHRRIGGSRRAAGTR